MIQLFKKKNTLHDSKDLPGYFFYGGKIYQFSSYIISLLLFKENQIT